MATPLKIKDANGNIQQLTTTDENYVAYQVGLHLSTADSAEVGSLNRSTGGDTVGTFSNTFFNQPSEHILPQVLLLELPTLQFIKQTVLQQKQTQMSSLL